jgi:hypothetical protein
MRRQQNDIDIYIDTHTQEEEEEKKRTHEGVILIVVYNCNMK